MYTTDELFDESNQEAGGGPGRLHDVLIELHHRRGDPEPFPNYTNAQLRIVFDSLPVHIRDIAHCWTISDTVFGDEAFTYLECQGIPYLPDAA